AVDRGGAEVLVEAGDEDDVVLGEQLRVALEREIEAPERRAAVARDQRRRAHPAPRVGAVLIERQANERLDAGQKDRALVQAVLGVEREVVVTRHALLERRVRGRGPDVMIRARAGRIKRPMKSCDLRISRRWGAAVRGEPMIGESAMAIGLGLIIEGEHAMFGVPFPPLKERMDRFECGARAIRALWQGRPVTLEQPYYALRDAESYPLPPGGRVPLIVGGRGEKRTLPIVAACADEWNITRITLDEYPAKRGVLDALCRKAGRDAKAIRGSLM